MRYVTFKAFCQKICQKASPVRKHVLQGVTVLPTMQLDSSFHRTHPVWQTPVSNTDCAFLCLLLLIIYIQKTLHRTLPIPGLKSNIQGCKLTTRHHNFSSVNCRWPLWSALIQCDYLTVIFLFSFCSEWDHQERPLQHFCAHSCIDVQTHTHK